MKVETKLISVRQTAWRRHEEAVTAWAQERALWPRVLGVVFFFWLLRGYWLDPSAPCWFDGVNLVIHEAGHLLFSWFGQFLMVLGGTLFQLLVPFLCGVAFLVQPDYFGVGFCGLWWSSSLFHVATYMADARAQALPLVGLGSGDPQHDWTTLLSQTGLLSADTSLALLLRTFAYGVMVISLAYLLWLLYRLWAVR